MNNLKSKFLTAIISLSISCSAQEVLPLHINGFTIRVTPPGNEYYEAPPQEVDTSKGELPSSIENIVRQIAPAKSTIESWNHSDDHQYSVTATDGDDRYSFTFTDSSELINLRYRNYSLYKQEAPGQMVLSGSLRAIPKSDVPQKLIDRLHGLGISGEPKTYTAETAHGKRFIVVSDNVAYFGRPDGQIQAAGLIDNGALKENNSKNNESLKTDHEILQECDSLLGIYRRLFNFDDEVKRVKANNPDGKGFRFIAMGDNRSNMEVWSTIIEHISELRPRPAFIVNSGDLVPNGYAHQYADYFIPPLVKAGIPYFVAIGNHDCGVRDSTIEYRYLFGENALNYCFDYGHCRFIMFDNSSRINIDGQSLLWLDSVLSTTPKNYSKFVFAHSPPNVLDKWKWHAWDSKNSRIFVDLMTKYKVKDVFLGHIHCYSTATINGISYTVSGGGGAPLYKRFGDEGNLHHYIICDVMPDGTVHQQVVKFYKDTPNKN